jgi:hypothetical protein
VKLVADASVAAKWLVHLRYHLFCFLARFFTEAGRQPYEDILTLMPLS